VDLSAQRFSINPVMFENSRRNAITERSQAIKQMLWTDRILIQRSRFFLRNPVMGSGCSNDIDFKRMPEC